MSGNWTSLLDTGSPAWASLTGEGSGVISGSADVQSSVESSLALFWQVSGPVWADFTLIYDQAASPISSVEHDQELRWSIDTAAPDSVESDLVLLWNRGGSVTSTTYLLWQVSDQLDVAGARVVRHPGWNRKRAAARLAQERAMERSIRERLNPTVPRETPMVASLPPQRTAGQMATEMAMQARAVESRRRATELGIEAQRARIEIARLQPELAARRVDASYRVVEQLLRNL